MFQATFSPSPEFNMAKKKSLLKRKVKRFLKASIRKKANQGRGPSDKPKHSKVAKMIKLAKMRARKGKVKKVVKKRR